MLVRKGDIKLDINLERQELTAGSLMTMGPQAILSVAGVDNDSEIDVYTLFISERFMHDVNIDMNVLNMSNVSPEPHRVPVMHLTDHECDLLEQYFSLLHHNTTANTTDMYVKSIARNLIASVVYQLLQFRTLRTEPEEAQRPLSRRMSYVHEFMRLVQKYHTQERSVGFYAGKLFISPKYLSLVIKEATGKSAAEWIDDCVILEAKNQLRFSGKNIQQVAYALNFTNQSAFGKYFKHLTGMSPSEYLRV
jgi:AraC-like DNA-binding protein